MYTSYNNAPLFFSWGHEYFFYGQTEKKQSFSVKALFISAGRCTDYLKHDGKVTRLFAFSNGISIVTKTNDIAESKAIVKRCFINVPAGVPYSIVASEDAWVVELLLPKHTTESERHPDESDNRPWGHFDVLYRGPDVVIKAIQINPGERLSAQYHDHRSEKWLVVEGTLVQEFQESAESAPTIVAFEQGSGFSYGPGVIHRPTARGSATPVLVLEAWLGDRLEESDIHRLSDDHGRH